MSHNTTYIAPAEGALTVFTDGSSLPKPRRGGIGIWFVYTDRSGNEDAWESIQLGVAGATNNQMELLAVVTAMKEIQDRRFRPGVLEQVRKIDIYTDSQYVVKNIYNAASTWPHNGWMTRNGPPVENVELWKDMIREYKKLKRIRPTEIKWGKGHSANNPHNKKVDKLAKESAKRPARPPLVPPNVRRKKSPKPLEIGSVEMLGQRLCIRIFKADYLKTQKVQKYWYEVVSPGSRFFGYSDIAYSNEVLMRSGHTYQVTMNRNQQYPMIVKCRFEVPSTKD